MPGSGKFLGFASYVKPEGSLHTLPSPSPRPATLTGIRSHCVWLRHPRLGSPQHVLMYDSVGMDRSVAKDLSHPTFVAPQNRLMPRLIECMYILRFELHGRRPDTLACAANADPVHQMG